MRANFSPAFVRFEPYGESRLRLLTIVRLRWLALLAQALTVGFVWLLLDFPLPIGPCLLFIAVSAWLNVFLTVRFPARHRLDKRFATAVLAYDILQLALLLYLTGGIQNPFSMLIVAPVVVSAATLPPRYTLLLGAVAAVAAAVVTFAYWPLPWQRNVAFELPIVYKLGILTAVVANMAFIALYAWRLAKESRQMSGALAATEAVLAREQKLHALDDLAAAAAHELGTPLSTIAVVARELERGAAGNAALVEDVALLRSQTQRCREILQKLSSRGGEADPLLGAVTVSQLINEAAKPYRGAGKTIDIKVGSASDSADAGLAEPTGQRQPGVIYGLGNIIENAVEFAASTVRVDAEWTENGVTVTVADDGPGFPPELVDQLGEPYVSKRAATQGGRTKIAGLGLGFFIAKTLLERSGATVALENKPLDAPGAVVRVAWRRADFEDGRFRVEGAGRGGAFA